MNEQNNAKNRLDMQEMHGLFSRVCEYRKIRRITMKALFLAGGMGTRLKPLTDDIPKSMVPIMNKPLLERSMENLIRYGIRDIVLSLGYKSDYIQNYFGDGHKLGLNIEYVFESSPLGTGGAIRNSRQLYNDTFVVMNADILCDINIAELIGYHSSKSADVTIAVTKVSNPSDYGMIETDENGYASAFTEKPEPEKVTTNYINAGIYVFEPHILDEIPSGEVVSIERDTFPSLLAKSMKIAVYKGGSYWIDIGTPEKYLKAHEDIMSGKCLLAGVDFGNLNIVKSGESFIDGTAKINGPVFIGHDVQIGAHTTIGPYAVIGDNANILHDGSITGSILWDHVRIGSYGAVDGSVVTSDCHVKRRSVHHDMAFTKTASVAW